MNGTDHTHHLQELAHFFANPAVCRDSFRLLIHFAVRLAAAGHTAEVLSIVERASDPALFQPLADGLRLHLGDPMLATGNSRKLALQIASRISAEVSAHNESRMIA
jgi:hypothetical protein